MPIAPERSEQPAHSPESAPAEQKSFREAALERLQAERGGAPIRESARAEQPEAVDIEESSDVGDESPEAEIDVDLVDVEESDEEEPGTSDAVIEVEGHQFTAETIRELLDAHDQAVNARKEYDADYRRKTQTLARIRQEYEAHGQEVTEVSNFFVNLAQANVRQLEQMDPSQMDQTQFAQWRQQLAAAQQGRDQLLGMVKQTAEQVQKRRDEQLNHQAKESSDILAGIDRRWNNEFYGKIRDWAVKSERYTAKEFADVVDWRTMEGLIALYDREEAAKKITNTEHQQDAPTERRRQRAQRQAPRDRNGRFAADARKSVMESQNAKADGSLRNFFQQRLKAERK